MANAMYPTYKEGLLDKLFDMNSDVIKASLINTAGTGTLYIYSAAHDEYSGGSRDVALASIIAESGALGSPTIALGVFDTADFTWTAVTGTEVEAIIVWDDTIANDRLVIYYDTSITGMPLTPNGGNVNATVHASGWFAL